MTTGRLAAPAATCSALVFALCVSACGGAAAPADAFVDGPSADLVTTVIGDLALPPDLASNVYCGPVNLTGVPACDDCLARHCCTVIATCEGDGGCSNEWDHSAIVECSTNTCAAACNHAPAKCGGINATPQSCANCVYTNCCAEATTCGMNDGCLALIYQCLDRDSAGEGTCEQRHPTGAADFESLNDCGTRNCPGCF